MKRRNFITAAAVAPFAGAGTLKAGPIDPQNEIDALIFIADKTGLPMDDLVNWLKGVDVLRVAENVKKPSIKWDEALTKKAVLNYQFGDTFQTPPWLPYAAAQLRAKGAWWSDILAE